MESLKWYDITGNCYETTQMMRLSSEVSLVRIIHFDYDGIIIHSNTVTIPSKAALVAFDSIKEEDTNV